MNKRIICKTLRELALEIREVTVTLFRIMIPAIIIIKILETLGGIELLSAALAPVMSWVGLPEAMGIVWATTLLTNIYTGMLVFFTHASASDLSVAQVTVLSGMMLMAHALPIEARIAQKAGVRLGFTLVLRIGGALAYGGLLNYLYSSGNWLQQTNHLLWQPEINGSHSLSAWAIEQVQGLFAIFLVICILLASLKLLKLLGIEKVISYLLSPLLKLLKIGREASSITLIGITLGLSFGGGLLIKEARAGHVSRQDVFSSMGLLALTHSVIEDTLLVMLLGAHISGALWLRVAFSLIIISLLVRWFLKRSEAFKSRFLLIREP